MTLREKLEELSARLIDNPSAGQRVTVAESELVGPYKVRIRSGGHEVIVDEPTKIGGDGSGPSPVEMALVALGSCQAITYRLWAVRLGMGRLSDTTRPDQRDETTAVPDPCDDLVKLEVAADQLHAART